MRRPIARLSSLVMSLRLVVARLILRGTPFSCAEHGPFLLGLESLEGHWLYVLKSGHINTASHAYKRLSRGLRETLQLLTGSRV